MSNNPEKVSSDDQVFSVLNRLSKGAPEFGDPYIIGDGIVVRMGWITDTAEVPGLTLELQDMKLDRGITLTVGTEQSRYARDTEVLSPKDWLYASEEKKQQMRLARRREIFSTPNTSIAPIVNAMLAYNQRAESGPTERRISSLEVNPQPGTDISFIRQLIEGFSRPLDSD